MGLGWFMGLKGSYKDSTGLQGVQGLGSLGLNAVWATMMQP